MMRTLVGTPQGGAEQVAHLGLRPALRENADVLAALYLAAYPPGVGATDLDDARADITASFDGEYGPLHADASLVASLEGQPVGAVLTVTKAPWPDTPQLPFVIELFVDAGARRRGIGEALLLAAARATGGPIALRVDSDNTAAVSLYERLGLGDWPR